MVLFGIKKLGNNLTLKLLIKNMFKTFFAVGI